MPFCFNFTKIIKMLMIVTHSNEESLPSFSRTTSPTNTGDPIATFEEEQGLGSAH
jgi:hypothetical protein